MYSHKNLISKVKRELINIETTVPREGHNNGFNHNTHIAFNNCLKEGNRLEHRSASSPFSHLVHWKNIICKNILSAICVNIECSKRTSFTKIKLQLNDNWATDKTALNFPNVVAARGLVHFPNYRCDDDKTASARFLIVQNTPRTVRL